MATLGYNFSFESTSLVLRKYSERISCELKGVGDVSTLGNFKRRILNIFLNSFWSLVQYIVYFLILLEKILLTTIIFSRARVTATLSRFFTFLHVETSKVHFKFSFSVLLHNLRKKIM